MFDWFKRKKNVEENTEENIVESVVETTEETTDAVSAEFTEEAVEEAKAEVVEKAKEEEVATEVTAKEPVEEVVAEVVEKTAAEEVSKVEEVSILEEVASEASESVEPITKMGLFSRLKAGLTKTRNNIVASMDSIFSNDDKIDEDFYDELEEILILGDIGVHTTENILDKLRGQVKSEHIKKKSECREFLINTIKEEMAIGETAYEFEITTSVVFVIGVNGVGKTTSIGKLASHLKAQGRKVMLAACDTFRAAAGSQLEEWSHRAGVEMIGGVEGQDPSSVLFDAVTAAKARGVDVLLVDTAGRLHNKKNLMEELKKMNRIIDKVFPEVHRENMIVLDASTGQNALNQAKEFGEVANLTGIILTKMDGTAKGGIAIAIQSELGVPVKYIGVGEKIVDLQKFNADSFVDALFDVKLEEEDNE